jgi:hypothetical protein
MLICPYYLNVPSLIRVAMSLESIQVYMTQSQATLHMTMWNFTCTYDVIVIHSFFYENSSKTQSHEKQFSYNKVGYLWNMFRYAIRNRPDQDKRSQREFLIKFMVNIFRNNRGLLYHLNTHCVGSPHLRRSSDSVVTGLLAGVRFQAGKQIFVFSAASRPTLGSIQPRIQCFPDPVSLGVKRLGHEVNHIYYYLFNCNWSFTRWQWHYNKTRHTNNTHHTKYHTKFKQNTAHRTTPTTKDTLHTRTISI